MKPIYTLNIDRALNFQVKHVLVLDSGSDIWESFRGQIVSNSESR